MSKPAYNSFNYTFTSLTQPAPHCGTFLNKGAIPPWARAYGRGPAVPSSPPPEETQPPNVWGGWGSPPRPAPLK